MSLSLPKVSICIPTFNHIEDYLQPCIDSIVKYTNPTMYQIIIFDNGSDEVNRLQLTKMIYTIYHKWPQVCIKRYQHPENIGFPKACNFMIRNSIYTDTIGEEIIGDILFLNNDTIVTEHWLEVMQEVAYSHERIGLVGPVTDNCYSMQQFHYLVSKGYLGRLSGYVLDIDTLASFLHQLYQLNHIFLQSNQLLSFFCTYIKHQCIDEVGLLDENFGLGLGEDNDYCDRCDKMGWLRVIALGAFVHHQHRGTLREFGDEEIAKMQAKNIEYLNQKQKEHYEG